MSDSPFEKLNRRNLRHKESLHEEVLNLSLQACNPTSISEAFHMPGGPRLVGRCGPRTTGTRLEVHHKAS